MEYSTHIIYFFDTPRKWFFSLQLHITEILFLNWSELESILSPRLLWEIHLTLFPGQGLMKLQPRVIGTGGKITLRPGFMQQCNNYHNSLYVFFLDWKIIPNSTLCQALPQADLVRRPFIRWHFTLLIVVLNYNHMQCKKFAFGVFSAGCACKKNITYGYEIMLEPESAHNVFRQA